MDHTCHKCGHNTEDGKAFCSQCGAPQIRVLMPEPALEPSIAGYKADPAHDSDLNLAFPSLPVSPVPAGWSQAIRPAAIASAVAALFLFLGVNPFVGALGAGFLALVLSRRRGQEIAVRAAAGARLGAISGVFLFAVSTVLELLAVVVLHKGAEIRGEMMGKVQEMAMRHPGPQVQPFLDFVNSPGGFTFLMIFSLLFGLLAFVALGALGGVLGASLIGRRGKP